MKVNIITMGCSKNLVDSERLMAQLMLGGHQVMHENYDSPSDVVIVNTCGFILDAKEESIEAILGFIGQKERGEIQKLLVMGCLSERYKEELQVEMPEVDAFFGVWELPAIVNALGSSLEEALLHRRMLTTPSHYAYVKISEGCNRSCAFCAIPGIRGQQQSLSIDSILEECKELVSKGVKEIMLIAQDLTNYGIDLYEKRALADLLRELVKVEGLEWIRLHYAYPTGFPEEVIELMAGEEKICNYLDIPIQHVNDRVLSAMKRGHGKARLVELLGKFRSLIPDVALRTTVMTGYPGEGEEEFRELLDFISEFRFERLGVFPYSREEGTPAGMLEDTVDEKEKSRRASTLMEIQQQISLELNEARIGKVYKVIVDEFNGETYAGRTQYDSPEVDNEVLISPTRELQTGEFYKVKITAADEFDIFGEVIE